MPSLIVEGKKYRVGDISGEDPFWTIPVDEKNVNVELLGQPSGQSTLFMRAGNRVIGVTILGHQGQRVYFVEVSGRPLTVTLEDDVSSGPTGLFAIVDGPALVNSPMAGKIALVKTSVNSKVEEGQSLMVLEAMKMQNEIASPKRGIVKELYVKHGDLVRAGDMLCLVE
jgi:acetyl/propionyl-CoA carboxylase alpha subunit